MPKAIIVGASSGIGRALAKCLSADGYEVGAMARRLPLLLSLQEACPAVTHICQVDVADPGVAQASVRELITAMGAVDLIVVSAGVGFVNPTLALEQELATIATNVSGFTAICGVAFEHFASQHAGHLVGVSSVAAIRGSPNAPAYNATKAYVSNYLEGLRKKAARTRWPIAVTEVRPGFVDTQMAKGEGLFWVASPEVAARQISRAIRARRARVYVTRRWALIGWCLGVVPRLFYDRM